MPPHPPDPPERAAALGAEIAAAAAEIERDQAIPEPLLTRLHAAALPRLLLPRALGGEETPPWVYAAAIAAASRHDASVGWNLFVANSAALIAPFLPESSAREIFASPRAWVAWDPPDGTEAAAVPGGYRVSGTWHFASGSRQASWMGAHCPVREADGSLRRLPDGRVAIRTLLFPAAAAERIADWQVSGLRGTASEGYRVRDLFVPEAFSATRELPETRSIPGKLFAFTMQGLYAVGVAAVACGIARGMLAEFAALAAAKAPRGQARLAENALTRAGFARAEAGLGAAEAYLEAVLRAVWETAPDWGAIGLEARARVRLACSHAIAAAVAAGDWAHHAAGVDAIFTGNPLERRFRDLHTLSQQIQARESHFEAVGAVLLGAEPAVFY